MPPSTFASRPDPASPLYQAWFGVYTIGGGKSKFASSDAKPNLHEAVTMAEFDQRSWLGAMGDPKPVATSRPQLTTSTMEIDGARRTLYHFDMDSHSDLSVTETPLVHLLGMPQEARWDTKLAAFHDTLLHVEYASGTMQSAIRRLLFMGVSTAFHDKAGAATDNTDRVKASLNQMMQSVRITDVKRMDHCQGNMSAEFSVR